MSCYHQVQERESFYNILAQSNLHSCNGLLIGKLNVVVSTIEQIKEPLKILITTMIDIKYIIHVAVPHRGFEMIWHELFLDVGLEKLHIDHGTRWG